MHKARSISGGVLLLAAMAACTTGPVPLNPGNLPTVTISIVGTNDIHGA
jgi:2',3'-cyclic-nucleotide 2'-phosphodiesterase (5'-nucleotidase family)